VSQSQETWFKKMGCELFVICVAKSSKVLQINL